MTPYYDHAGITIYRGDCRKILPQLPRVDLVLTDPPYGINYKVNRGNKRRMTSLAWASGHSKRQHDPEWIALEGDDRQFEPEFLLLFPKIILWGANNYASKLPDSRGWLIWDKLGNKASSDQGDCELAWTNINTSIRIHRQLWRGIVREGIENVANGPKVHPCQKPIRLMRWCILQADDPQTILDPFMGSGTTLVAAKQLGRKAIGIEIEEKYCEIAVKRLSQEILPLVQTEAKYEQGKLTDLGVVAGLSG